MSQLVQIIGLPFLACVMMGSILGYMGIHVLKREVIFVDIALAQVAAVGAIISHLAFEAHDGSVFSYVCSLSAVFFVAAFYVLARIAITQISLEAVIGISYAIAAAAALFLVGIAPGGHIHIQEILSGSLLWTSWRDIIIGLPVFLIVGFCFFVFRKPFSSMSNNYRQIQIKKVGRVFWDFIFYLLLGIIITLSVQMGGIVVVFAYLIIPATISAVLTSRPGLQLVIIWTATIAGSISGLLFAYYLDFSIGPAIALFLGIELIITALFARLTIMRQNRYS
jgi:zinc/manganese transport system permease protein